MTGVRQHSMTVTQSLHVTNLASESSAIPVTVYCIFSLTDNCRISPILLVFDTTVIMLDVDVLVA